MTDFFRYPHTPHLVWLGEGLPRDDKVLSPVEASALLDGSVVVEEKLDGANLGLSLDADGDLRAQNRGQYLIAPHAGQFVRLPTWLANHATTLRSVLTPNLIVFGEWCAARHSLDYPALPDWFLLFDVYDRGAQRFWSTSRRIVFAQEAALTMVPRLHEGKTTIAQLQEMVANTRSRFRHGTAEGVVIRRESAQWCDARAKLVRPDFTQSIATHWRNRAIEWNRILYSSGDTG